MGKDRGICWFRYPCFRIELHIVNFKCSPQVSIQGSISELESFVMGNEYLNKVEDNSFFCAWSEKTQLEKGDSVTEGDLILTHPDVKKRLNILALSIYGLVIFPKAIGHIDEAVADLFDRIGKQNTPVLAILAKTIRSLSMLQSWNAYLFANLSFKVIRATSQTLEEVSLAVELNS
ncbi:hypothetical protein PVK06_047368 [Gossypium arboreum]|uniref:DUF7745 domain-containing protein n=1 Tax=Gossypium arboreum TaxID=29729 RepID=A0ABR0MD55_GOSAR|nr:hypothetical protein PVK06_047368 [Gossypium arboreum]